MLLDEFKNAKFGEDKADRACFEIIQNLSSITFNTEKRARKNLEFEKYVRRAWCKNGGLKSLMG